MGEHEVLFEVVQKGIMNVESREVRRRWFACPDYGTEVNVNQYGFLVLTHRCCVDGHTSEMQAEAHAHELIVDGSWQ